MKTIDLLPYNSGERTASFDLREGQLVNREYGESTGLGRSVYVIDNDADVRDSLKFLLSTRNASVFAFKRDPDFLDCTAGLTPAPLIIDVRMPVMDGLQLL